MSNGSNDEYKLKYIELLGQYKTLLEKTNKTLGSYSNLLNGMCDYIEELQSTKRWWYISSNFSIANRLLNILATRKNNDSSC